MNRSTTENLSLRKQLVLCTSSMKLNLKYFCMYTYICILFIFYTLYIYSIGILTKIIKYICGPIGK